MAKIRAANQPFFRTFGLIAFGSKARVSGSKGPFLVLSDRAMSESNHGRRCLARNLSELN
jgi:hypothetical protein